MRIFCGFICLFLSSQFCISCQKQLSFDDLPDNTGDSITLIKTIKGINYDANDAFDWQTTQVFTYDSSLNRTVVNMVDSGVNIPGTVDRYTEIFQYDAQKRLSQFTSTSPSEPAAQIDFTYNSAGDIATTTMQDRWLGKTIICQYASIVKDGQKVIMVYDTSGTFDPNGSDSRPEISKFVFDNNNLIVNETIYYTLHQQPDSKYRDTFETRNYYDNNNAINKVIKLDKYLFNPAVNIFSYSKDSILYSSGGNAVELRNSFLYVYRNMYWLNISEFSTGFANAINKGEMLPYSGSPIKTGEQWSFFPPDPAIQDHFQGLYQNTFDANGLLTSSVYPKKFANKYGGKAEVWYTYTKIKKR